MEEKQEVISPMMEMTAGEMLRNARTTGRRKREISTIAKLLCIKEEFLEALETGNYRVIPEDVYILGFARSYAVELGLNPDEVIQKLKKELGIVPEEKDDEEEKSEPCAKAPCKINKEMMLKYAKSSYEYVKKHWVWFASGLLGVIVVILLCVILFSAKPTSESESVNDVTVAEENVVQVVKKEPDFRYPVHEKFDAKNKKTWADSRVVLQAEKESWIQIKDARGNTVFTRVLVPGDVYYMPLSDNYKGTFGNAGAIDVWVDGQLLKKIGPANTRKEGVSMSPDALKSFGFAE